MNGLFDLNDSEDQKWFYILHKTNVWEIYWNIIYDDWRVYDDMIENFSYSV